MSLTLLVIHHSLPCDCLLNRPDHINLTTNRLLPLYSPSLTIALPECL